MTTLSIELRGVHKSFGPTSVLEDVNLAIEERRFVGIIGPNGGGKTVLLKLILGLLRPDRGVIRVLGKSPEEARGKVGYVPQYARFDTSFPIDVRDVVLTGRQTRGKMFRRYDAEDKGAAARALATVELSELARRQIGKLSGGQLQRVLIARALVGSPEILLLDEPTANLDPHMGHAVYELLARLSKDLSIVIVSHDIGVISGYVDSVACVNRRVLQHPTGDPPRDVIEAIYGCPVHFIAHHPGEAKRHPHHDEEPS